MLFGCKVNTAAGYRGQREGAGMRFAIIQGPLRHHAAVAEHEGMPLELGRIVGEHLVVGIGAVVRRPKCQFVAQGGDGGSVTYFAAHGNGGDGGGATFDPGGYFYAVADTSGNVTSTSDKVDTAALPGFDLAYRIASALVEVSAKALRRPTLQVQAKTKPRHQGAVHVEFQASEQFFVAAEDRVCADPPGE